MSKKRERQIPSITYNYVEPENVYKGQYNIPLAESFAENRYLYNPKLDTYSIRNNRFGSNAGAVQLFDRESDNTLTEPKGNLAEYTENEDGKYTRFGHSERVGMRDILNEFIPENTGQIEKPSYYARTPNEKNQPLNILRQLMLHANDYKDYLTSQNAIVKMWSEQPACHGNIDIATGSNCKDFMSEIAPDGSKYMYIVNDKYNTDLVKKASEELKDAYLKHKRNPLSYTKNVNEYKKQRINSPKQESTPEKETLDGLTMEQWLEILEKQ